MLLLEYANRIIEDTLFERFAVQDGAFEALEAVVADFDAVTFHLATDASNKAIIIVSMSMKCYGELRNNGVDDLMNSKFGAYITEPKTGYDITLAIDCASFTSKSEDERRKFAHEVALLKRHALASAFYKAFNEVEKKQPGNLIEVRYRDEEAIFIKPENDRCTVIFNIQFKDADDAVLSKTFLQEYQDARKTMNNVPFVGYSQKEPPGELKGVKNVKVGQNNGFVSFVLFAPHMTTTKREKTIDNIQTFRNYLHYHIKCSKAYLHTRMRNRVRNFLQVLNRAKMEVESKEKKTITGRTFKRADEPEGADQEYNI